MTLCLIPARGGSKGVLRKNIKNLAGRPLVAYLTNLQAAMGCAQMEKLDEYISAKRQIAGRYQSQLSEFQGLTVMPEAKWAFSIMWMCTALVNETEFGMNSRELLRKLASSQIQARSLWQPLHLSPAHGSSQSCHDGTAERLVRDAVSLPCSVGLTRSDQSRVIDTIRQLSQEGLQRKSRGK